MTACMKIKMEKTEIITGRNHMNANLDKMKKMIENHGSKNQRKKENLK